MPKQIHVRLDERIYETLAEYAVVTKKPVQDCVTEALALLFDDKYREQRNQQGRFTFIDLFAGIGGMRLAFESNGGKCVFSSEWDRYCQKTYFDNFGVLPHGDITKIDEKDIPDHDILVAGFPCQPFSIAGVSKKNSLGRATGFLDKTQGTLFFDVVRIINEKRPKAFLLENVKNLRSHDKGNTWRVVMEALEELDYEVFSDVLDGQMFSPQHRERVIIVGFDRKKYGDDIQFDFQLKAPDKAPKVKDILEKSVDKRYTLSDHLWQYLQNYAAKHQAKGNGFGYGLANLYGVTRTLSARYYKDGSEILIPQKSKNPRRLTPRECARLQGYDDSFIISVSDTQAYKQFGNSVVVPLIKAVAKKIVDKLESMPESEVGGEKVG
ncbi:MAG: DNA (cytosine-5-)-methyltransferase [Syntrophorhabdus sp.]